MLVLYDYCNELLLLVMEATIVYGESFEALLLRHLQPVVQFYVEVEVGTCLLVAPLFANKRQMTIPFMFISFFQQPCLDFSFSTIFLSYLFSVCENRMFGLSLCLGSPTF